MDADKIQTNVFRKMKPEERLRIAGQFYSFVKKIVAQESGEKIYERIRRAVDKSGVGS